MPYWSNAELKRNRAVQDKILAARHHDFDLAAKDRTPKCHRHHWAVVGEGSATSQENFRRNYALINWRES